jgi:hypothetical protein
VAELVGGGGYRFAAKADGDGFSGRGPSPNVHWLITLENHVVGENSGKSNFCGEAGDQNENELRKKQEPFHAS